MVERGYDLTGEKLEAQGPDWPAPLTKHGLGRMASHLIAIKAYIFDLMIQVIVSPEGLLRPGT